MRWGLWVFCHLTKTRPRYQFSSGANSKLNLLEKFIRVFVMVAHHASKSTARPFRPIPIKSFKATDPARFFAPRLFEAFRKSKRYLRPPIFYDLRGCEDLKPGHLYAACLKEAR